MGARGIVLFKDRYGYSPMIYLHWLGPKDIVATLLDACGDTLRKGSASYSAAHFCGVTYNLIASVEKNSDGLARYGLALFNATPEEIELLEVGTPVTLDEVADRHGLDEGICVVDVEQGIATHCMFGKITIFSVKVTSY